MIGWLRAAWDDSRRAAYSRRGSNPMSREEWFELHDLISKLDSKISQLPDLDTLRKLFDLYRTKDVYTNDVYTNDLDEYLDAIGVTAPFTDAQEARIREHGDELIKSVGNLIAGFFGGDGVKAESTSAETADSEEDALDAERRHQVHTDHALALAHLLGLRLRAGPADRAAINAFVRNHKDFRFQLTDYAKQGGQCGVDNLGIRLIPKDPLVDIVDGVASADGIVGNVVRDGLHDSSPSADDAGAHSVGEGEVAGVETAAPVTDATDSSEDEAGCSAQVMLAGHVIDVTLRQNEYIGAVTMSINLPDGLPVWRTMTLGELRLR